MARPVVLVTGCSAGGIGHALCAALLAAGCRVFASARRLAAMEGLQELGAELVTLDVTVQVVGVNLCLQDSVTRCVAEVIAKAGHVDILINNAGISAVGPVAEIPLETVRNTFETNGTLRTIQEVVPHMVKQGHGKIVNVGSIVGFVSTPWGGIYSASKSAVHALTDSLRMELLPFNIHVTLVAPGAIRSNIASNGAARDGSMTFTLYAPYQKAIDSRRGASQTKKSTPANIFADKVVTEILKPHPPARLVLGHLSTVAYILWLLPTWLRDYYLASVSSLTGRPPQKSSEAFDFFPEHNDWLIHDSHICLELLILDMSLSLAPTNPSAAIQRLPDHHYLEDHLKFIVYSVQVLIDCCKIYNSRQSSTYGWEPTNNVSRSQPGWGLLCVPATLRPM
eukprot:SM000391S15182  [mRNA]  locus=s391:29087:31377:+ [translate_table: standard]